MGLAGWYVCLNQTLKDEQWLLGQPVRTGLERPTGEYNQ